MRIVLLSNTAWYLWNFRRGLIRKILETGNTVYVVVPEDGSVAHLKQLGCKLVLIPMSSKGINPIQEFRLLIDYVKSLRAIRAEAILTFTIKPVIYGGLVGRFLGIPVVHTITGLGTIFIHQGWITRIVRMLYRAALFSANRVYFQNTDDRKMFESMRLVRIGTTDLIPGSGVDTQYYMRQLFPKNSAVRNIVSFIFIGRILKDKGIYEFLEAAKHIKNKRQDAKFVVLGPLGVDNISALKSKHLDPFIRGGIIEYLGDTDDVRPFIDAADCVVLPSYREGLPRSLLEASSMCKPIIATDVSGCRDVVQHGLNGLLCKPKSSLDLATRMDEFLNLSAKDRERMGEEGRSRVIELFDENQVIEKYISTLSSISNSTA